VETPELPPEQKVVEAAVVVEEVVVAVVVEEVVVAVVVEEVVVAVVVEEVVVAVVVEEVVVAVVVEEVVVEEEGNPAIHNAVLPLTFIIFPILFLNVIHPAALRMEMIVFHIMGSHVVLIMNLLFMFVQDLVSEVILFVKILLVLPNRDQSANRINAPFMERGVMKGGVV